MAKKKEGLKERLKKKQVELSKGGGGGYPFFTFKEGVFRMRPLYVGEDEEFAIEATYFYLAGDIKGVISPATWGDKCAIMSKYTKLKNSSDDDDKELANTFKPKRRYFSPHIKYKDLKGKDWDKEAGIKLALLANSQYNDLIELFLDDENGDFTDPKQGYDIKYKRTGTGMLDTTYTLTPCRSTPLPKELLKKVISPEEMLRDLTPSFKQTKDYIATFLSGGESSSKPSKKKGKDI